MRNAILRTVNNRVRDRLMAKAEVVAQLLNDTEGESEQKPVLELMRTCEKLSALLPRIAPTKYVVRGTNRRVYDLKKDRSARRLLDKINRSLARWKFRKSIERYMMLAPGKPSSVSVVMGCINPGRFLKRSRNQMLEGDVCGALLELLEAHFLRVRKCAGYKLSGHKLPWFAAARPDQVHCDSKCAQKHYRETHRQQWASYMRDYRAR